MLYFLFTVILIIFTILCIKCSWNMKHFKEISSLQNISITEINDKLYDPCKFVYNFNNIDISTLIRMHHDKYFISNNNECIRFIDFDSNEECLLYENKELINLLNNTTQINHLINLYKTNYSFNNHNYASIFKGYYITPLLNNNNNTLLLSVLHGECNVYLFNPKHKHLIKDKELDEIYKLSIDISLHKNDVLYIPTNWNYMIKVNKECILIKSSMDTYFTFIYNTLRGG